MLEWDSVRNQVWSHLIRDVRISSSNSKNRQIRKGFMQVEDLVTGLVWTSLAVQIYHEVDHHRMKKV